MKGQYVADIKVGDEIRETFLLTKKIIRDKKGGGYFVTLEISDRTGNLDGVLWEDAEVVNKNVKVGDFVFVTGVINEYNGRPQIVVQNVNVVPEKEIDPTDFLPTTTRSIDDMFKEFSSIRQQLKDPHLKSLFNNFFPANPTKTEEKEFVDNFKWAPAAVQAHHARIGGLLEHTLTMLKIAMNMVDIYPDAKKDLLLVGTALHDIGKVREYSYKNRFAVSDEGQFLGHIVISYDMVKEQINKVKNFPTELAQQLLHMIISHHGELEWGSPCKPKTLEALILHFIDNLDSKVEMIRETQRRETNPDTRWSEFHYYLERDIFLPGKGSLP